MRPSIRSSAATNPSLPSGLPVRPRTEEGLLATMAAVGHVLRQTWDDHAGNASHGPSIAAALPKVKS